jgi:3-dehydroquinate synthase
VDASCGGKLAVDFNGLKNEIGIFRNPDKVIICTEFLKTLPKRQLISGMAEIAKHAILSGEEYFHELSNFNPDKPNWQVLSALVEKSVMIKNEFAGADPTEKGVRKMLNLGHTIGHAIESYSFTTGKEPLLHGEAVAVGLVCEIFLSNKLLKFPVQKMMNIVQYLSEMFTPYKFGYDQYDALIALMNHDKKNSGGEISFSLMSDFGQYHYDQHCTTDDIYQALSFYQQMNL